MLVTKGIWKNFGKLSALKDVSIEFKEKGIIAIIGPNGAGKTTLVNVITGALKEDSGKINLDGKEINRLPPHARIRMGISRTFQIPRPFSNLTVLENIRIGSLFSGNSNKREIEEDTERIMKLLGIKSIEGKPAGKLNTEERRLVDLGRSLASRPKYIFIDEMGAGLAEGEVISLSKLIKKIQIEEEMSVIYVGHVMKLVKELESPVAVFSEGSPIFQGSFEEVISNDEIIKLYLGDRYAKN